MIFRLRGDVELMVSCQCKIITVMGTPVCWYVATMNTNLTLLVLFIYLFIIASTQGMAKTMVLVRLYICHDTSPDMLFCDTITTLSHIILDASHHTHHWWMFLSCSLGGAGSHVIGLIKWWWWHQAIRAFTGTTIQSGHGGRSSFKAACILGGRGAMQRWLTY